jgi:hypothetical protein
MRRKDLLSDITYFDILVSSTALILIDVCLPRIVVHRLAWSWNSKDSLGLGLLLGAMFAFILLRDAYLPKAYSGYVPLLLRRWLLLRQYFSGVGMACGWASG